MQKGKESKDRYGGNDFTNLDDTECDGVLFEDDGFEHKFGTYSRKNQKMLMDEIGNVETEHSFREQTENDGMHSNRDLVTGNKSQKQSNSLAKSLHLPGNGSGSDKQSNSSQIGLGGIRLDFRKSSNGGGLMQMLKGSGSGNKIGAEVRSS